MLRAVLGVALLAVAGLMAFFLAGGTIDVEGQPAATSGPTWRVGDHLHYIETVNRTDVLPHGKEVFPGGPVDLHWYVVDMDEVATVVTHRTWTKPDGEAAQHWGRLELDGMTPTAQGHPLTLPDMAPGDSWTTGIGLLRSDGNETVSRVVRAEERDLFGADRIVLIIESEQRRDGVLVRNDTIAYAQEPDLIVSWRTQTWSREPYQFSTWIRDLELVAKDLQIAPEVDPTSIPYEVLEPVVHNRTLAGDDEWFRAFGDPWAATRVYAWTPWNDPWGLVDQMRWTLTHRHSSDLAFHDGPQFSVRLEQPGQYRLQLQLLGELNVVAEHTFGVGGLDDVAWTCGPIIDTWCTGPALELPPGWSRVGYMVYTDGEVRLIDQTGHVVHEGQEAVFTDGHHPDLVTITPQWRQITPRTTVQAEYSLQFHDDW